MEKIVKYVIHKIKNLMKFLVRNSTNRTALSILIGLLLFYRVKTMPKYISTSEFLDILNLQTLTISNLTHIENRRILFNTKNGHSYICSYFLQNLAAFENLLSSKQIRFNYVYGFEGLFINPRIHIIVLSCLLYLNMKNSFKDLYINYFKPTTRTLVESEGDVLKEFICDDATKDQINSLIDQLKNPKKYKNSKLITNKGYLLYGKPGTGKTLLARCISKISGITFISTCASEFIEIYVGTGPKKIREMFDYARKNSPAVIYIDEIESIGMQRPSHSHSYTNNIETYSTLNQLLSEMDGFSKDLNNNIYVIASTNREDLLDSALVRPGRFSHKIKLDLPNEQLRYKIFKLYLEKYKYDKNSISDELIREYASRSKNFTGSIIEGLINEAASLTVSKNLPAINHSILDVCFHSYNSNFNKFNIYEIRNSIV